MQKNIGNAAIIALLFFAQKKVIFRLFNTKIIGFEIQEPEDTINVYLIKDGTLFMFYPRKEFEKFANRSFSYATGVNAFIKIDKEAQQPKEPKEKTVEEPELSLPKLTRVVQYSEDPEQAKWSDYGMTSESIVKIQINPNGAIDEVLINMDSNLVKKLINAKGANVERVRNKYISSIYSHVLMVYTTMYGYYSKDDIEIDEYVRKDIQESLNAAVEFSFQYYANFLLTYESFSD